MEIHHAGTSPCLATLERLQRLLACQKYGGFLMGLLTVGGWSIQRTRERTNRTLVLMSQGSCKPRENERAAKSARPTCCAIFGPPGPTHSESEARVRRVIPGDRI